MQKPSFLLSEADCQWEICSAAGSDETADNLPGHGRLLGNLYSFIGEALETKLGWTAERMGFGPRAVAKNIRRIAVEDEDGYVWNNRRKRAEKKCKQLARYVK